METLWQDLRIGWRQLAAGCGFTAAAVLTLALGIGAAAAMLTVVNAVLVRALPYPDPGRLVVLEGNYTERGATKSWSISQLDFADWRAHTRAFSGMSVFGKLAFNLERGERSERLWGELVDAGYFALLGQRPALGRFFTADEDARPMEQYVVVLGYDLWRTGFGADPAVVGRGVHLNGRVYRVVGVGPRGFRGLTDLADLWVPSMVPPVREFLTVRRQRWAEGVARLRPGVTPRAAQQQLDAVAAGLARDFPDSNRGMGVALEPLDRFWFGDLRRGLAVLTLGAGFILLIACINVAGLLVTRAAARRRAFAIRVALGATRRRLLRQLLTESLLLAALGAAAGLLLAQWATRALIAASGMRLPSFVTVDVAPAVIAAVAGLAAGAGVVFGLAPLAITLRSGLTQSLGRDEKLPPRGGFQRFQSAVVIVQVALALTLAAEAGLMAKGFGRLIHQDLGFHPREPRALLTYRIDLRGPRYVDEDFDTRLLRESYLRRIAAVPGVEEVAMSDPNIPTDDMVAGTITVEDHDSEAPDGMYIAMMHAVTPAYFDLLGIPLQRGRTFNAQDIRSNAVVISRALAEQQWPGRDAIGRRLKLDLRANAAAPWLTVVGVVGDVRHEGILGERAPAPDLYLSLFQFIRRPPLTVNFLVLPRHGGAGALRQALHREMLAIDPELPDYDFAPFAARLARQGDRERFQVLLIGIFTLLALVLAAIGIYGVVSYNVAQARREVAIRLSLGATRGSILRLVVGRGARLGALGVALGLLGVAALRGLVAGVLFQTSAGDPAVVAGTCALLFLVILAANLLPARRAAAADPVAGLRLQ